MLTVNLRGMFFGMFFMFFIKGKKPCFLCFLFSSQCFYHLCNKLFVPKAALNIWIKNSNVNVNNYSLTRQQFSMIMRNLLQSLQIACSFTVFPSVRIGVLNCPLFPFNCCLTVIDCREIVLNCS